MHRQPRYTDSTGMFMFMFHSPIYQSAITHRYELTTVLRQENKEFLDALKEIRVGQCSEKTFEYINSLSRSLEISKDEMSHIYFRKSIVKRLPVALHNRLAFRISLSLSTPSRLSTPIKLKAWTGRVLQCCT